VDELLPVVVFGVKNFLKRALNTVLLILLVAIKPLEYETQKPIQTKLKLVRLGRINCR
jgi:hypothetical protein